MRFRLLPLFVLLLFFLPASAQKYLDMIEAGTYTLDAIRQEAEAYFNTAGRGRGTGYKQFKRWEYVAQMELDESGVKIANYDLSRLARDYRRAERLRQAESGNFSGDWKELGPSYKNATSSWNPGVGRITSIGIDATNNKHLIVGSPTGGVWKTLNGGNTWVNLTDDYSTVDVYALEISPWNNNHYLWGSTSGRVFRSTDGGVTWNATGNVGGSGRVSRIQYHPTDPNTVYAVSESNGLYRSTNGGASWSAVSGASSTSGYDVEFKPGDPNTIYFSGRNVYRSTNGGASFTQISGFGTATNNYKRMGVSPADPNVVYVLESNGGVFGAFYKSTNSGASFTKLQDGADINYFGYSATGDDDRGQAPRNMDVAVSPLDAEDVHIGGIHTWRSIDGGLFFFLTSYWVPSTAASLGVGYNHADIGIIKFTGDTMFVSTDGGIYHSLDGAASFIDRTPGLGIREFYKIGVSKTNPNVVSGGAQDNGTSVMRGANRAWSDWLGADGMESFVDWNNANILYGTSQNGSMYRSSNQGNSYTSISKPPDVEDGAWITPFEQDPQFAPTIYAAFADVWKTSNNGGTWTKISDFGSTENINHMKLAPSDNKRIYVARGSSLFTTANGGTNWTTITSAWGTNSISFIAVHPLDPQRLLIVTSSNVYHSTNAGSTWTNISSGLPSGTKYCAAWENKDKNGIYVGGFGFVSYTNDDLGGQWVGFFEGLPNARVYELEINYVSNTIFACTYGRGLWESPLYQLTPPDVAFEADKRVGCREMTVQFSDKSTNNPNAWNWTFEGGTPATSTLQNPVVTFSGKGAYTVRLTATNNAGGNTHEEVGYITLEGPAAPVVTAGERCGPGPVSVQATAAAGEQIRWYATDTAPAPLFTGDVFSTDISQTSTFFAAAGVGTLLVQRVGPLSNTIGGGSDHGGNQFLIFDATKSFRLKSAKVYAVGAKNRTFQVRNAAGVVLLEKTVFVNDGESRVDLDLDIPAGADLQIGCPSGANLYRNNVGVAYPYSISGLVSIKSSTAGTEYYYYLYDIEVERNDLCESDRVPVTATVHLPPDAPTLSAAGATALCPGASVVLTAENVCSGCTVQWSNGETGPSISVSADGAYSAIVSNNAGNGCSESPASAEISVTALALPDVPGVSAAGATTLCPGESVVLTAGNICAGCTVQWSNGETTPEITVFAAGDYTAVVDDNSTTTCSQSPASNSVAVATVQAPDAPTVVASGPTSLCGGETVVLAVDDLCAGCTVLWSTGETTAAITVATDGAYTATVANMCGESPASAAIGVTTGTAPNAPVLSASATVLCPGETIEITAGNLCADCSVLWSTGDTGPGITVSAEGMYTATVTNPCGTSPASEAVTVTTGSLPETPTILVTGSTLLCPGETVELTAENLCAGCIVVWSTGETTPAVTVAVEGAYFVAAANVCGVSPATEPVVVSTETLPAAPGVSASGSTMLCPGQTLVLTASDICSGCSILWSSGENTPEITVSASGTYSATVANVCGAGPASAEVIVTSENLPDAPVLSAAGTMVLCPGQTIMLTAENICAGCTVLWSTGETTPQINVSAAGAYTATVGNVCGSSPAAIPLELTAEALPVPPTLTALGATALCPNETVVLTAENICAGCNLLWSNGETTPVITVSGEGTYSAVVSNVCGSNPALETIEVTVYPPFQPVVQLADLCHLSAPEGSGYQWYLNGNPIPGADEQFWTALVAGQYSVAMNSPEGCPGISGDISAEPCASSTADLAGVLSAKLYPNPAVDRIFLEINTQRALDLWVDLFGADGRFVATVHRGALLPGGQTLDIALPELPSGVYRYRLVTESGAAQGNLVVLRR